MSTAFQDVGEARRAHQVTEARRTGRHTDLLRRVCHELLSSADISNVLHAVLSHISEHIGSEIAYLRVVDHEQPHTVIESVRGMAGRELDAVIAWLNQSPRAARTRSRAAARRERSDSNLDRFPIEGQPGIEGVLVLDGRAALGPSAFDDHSVIVAVTGLIADAVRYRRERAPTPLTLHTSVKGSSDPRPPVDESSPEAADADPLVRRSLKSLLFGFEREILVGALRDAEGNHSRAARALQTTPRILAYRLKRHGLHGDPRNPRDPRKPGR